MGDRGHPIQPGGHVPFDHVEHPGERGRLQESVPVVCLLRGIPTGFDRRASAFEIERLDQGLCEFHEHCAAYSARRRPGRQLVHLDKGRRDRF